MDVKENLITLKLEAKNLQLKLLGSYLEIQKVLIQQHRINKK